MHLGSALLGCGIDGDEGEDAETEEDCGGAVGGVVIEVLDLIVEDDGEGAGCAGNVSAEHKDDAELADGVKEAEDDGGEKGAARERDEDGRDKTKRSGAEKTRGVDKSGVDRGEAGDERLDGERKAVNDGADDESIERKCEGVAEEGGDVAANDGAGPEEDEKKEAQDGGRQDHGEGGEGLESGEPAAAAEDKQRRERDGDGEKNGGGDGCETKRESEGLPVHC